MVTEKGFLDPLMYEVIYQYEANQRYFSGGRGEEREGKRRRRGLGERERENAVCAKGIHSFWLDHLLRDKYQFTFINTFWRVLS